MTRAQFLTLVSKQPNGCWIWLGSYFSKGGYGSCSTKDDKTGRATHLAYSLFNGKPPTDAHILHTCDNKPCVCPKHLFAGTNRENAIDKVKKGRQRGGMPEGERCYWAKLTEQQVLEIRQKLEAGVQSKILAKEYKVQAPAIHKIKIRHTWRHI
jgi:hypothetical protein